MLPKPKSVSQELLICTMQGESENVLFRHEEAHPSTFETYIMRPGPVPSNSWSIRDTIMGLLGFVSVDVVSRAMIRLALNGSDTWSDDRNAPFKTGPKFKN